MSRNYHPPPSSPLKCPKVNFALFLGKMFTQANLDVMFADNEMLMAFSFLCLSAYIY